MTDIFTGRTLGAKAMGVFNTSVLGSPIGWFHLGTISSANISQVGLGTPYLSPQDRSPALWKPPVRKDRDGKNQVPCLGLAWVQGPLGAGVLCTQ